MTLHLQMLRHGETTTSGFRGSLDDGLTEHGWSQMRAAVATAGPWQRLVSSPLQRCARFAEQLAAERGLPLEQVADLRELHFGRWEGRTALQLMETDERGLGLFWEDPYAFTPPEGEPVQAFADRVFAALHRLQRDHDGERVLLITHAGVMRLVLAHARGLAPRQLLQVEVPHGALLGVDIDADGQWREVT